MSDVYSARFYSVKGLTGSALAFSVPTGETWILASVVGYNDDVFSATAFVEGDKGQAAVWLTNPIASGSQMTWNGRSVFYAGEDVYVNAASGTWDLTLCGYTLTDP